jgi:hypothetical protein
MPTAPKEIKLLADQSNYCLPQEWITPNVVNNWHNLPSDFQNQFSNPVGHILGWRSLEDDRPLRASSILYCVCQETRISMPSWGLLSVVSNCNSDWWIHEMECALGPYLYSCEAYEHVPTNSDIENFLNGKGMWNADASDWKLHCGSVCEEIWQDLIGESPLPILDI